jgi:hypothetical protein
MPGPGCIGANLYRVEVSGWDRDKSFFVETSDLEWSEQSGKRIILKRRLDNRAVVFLRLLQPMGPDRGHPVAYQAEFLTALPDGNSCFDLKPLAAERSSHEASNG